MNWDVVGKVAAELELGATLYYYLATLDRLAPGYVPGELLHCLHPSRSSRARDWGWQLASTLGLVDPFPLATPAAIAPFADSSVSRVLAQADSARR
jgi:hypothetical protein